MITQKTVINCKMIDDYNYPMSASKMNKFAFIKLFLWI